MIMHSSSRRRDEAFEFQKGNGRAQKIDASRARANRFDRALRPFEAASYDGLQCPALGTSQAPSNHHENDFFVDIYAV